MADSKSSRKLPVLRTLHHDGKAYARRESDGYFNATLMCANNGKLWADYARQASAKEFHNELATDMGIPISELIQSVKGGNPTRQGTWVHPQVAIDLAQWISPDLLRDAPSFRAEFMTITTSRIGALPCGSRATASRAELGYKKGRRPRLTKTAGIASFQAETAPKSGGNAGLVSRQAHIRLAAVLGQKQTPPNFSLGGVCSSRLLSTSQTC